MVFLKELFSKKLIVKNQKTATKLMSIFQWLFYTGFTVFRFLPFVVICNDCGVLMRIAKVYVNGKLGLQR